LLVIKFKVKFVYIYLYIESDSSTTTITMQHSQEEKKFALSPQAAEFVPRSMLLSQSHTSQSPSTQSPAAESNVFLPSVSDVMLIGFLRY